MPKAVWRRVGNTAVPADARSLEFLQARKDGDEFMADTRGARNPKQHRLWWALCKLVAENDDTYDTAEKAHKGLKRALHMVDLFMDRDGRLHVEELSIAFESMDQETFNGHFKNAINVVAGWLGSAPDEVQARFDEMVADKRYEGMRR